MNRKKLQSILTKLRFNKLIRSVLWPATTLRRQYLMMSYSKSADSKHIQTLKNTHLGERCFVIGNGPSLCPEDLERIKDEESFASNGIFHIFEKTQWRPSYYLSTDNDFIAANIKSIKQNGAYPKFINYKSSIYGRTDKNNITYLYLAGKFHIDPCAPQVKKLSDDISKYASCVHTVTVTAIELAVYMGFKKIYLLGVDNNYAKKIGPDGHIYNDPSVKADYFAGMKDANGKENSSVSVQSVDAMNYSYELAKDFAEEHGIKIYNATRGGMLEAFERVDFDELMKKE